MKKTKTIITAGIATVLAASTWYFGFYRPSKAITVTYRESTVEKGDIKIAIRATGTVQPENRLEIKAPIAGRAEKVLVKEGDRVRPSQIVAWMSSTERAAVLDAARAKGPDEVARWEDLYRPTPVVSPIHGTVIARQVEPGQTFTQADAILVLSDRLTVKAQVDETDLAKVKKGLPATITLDAYAGEAIPAKVEHIAFEAKTVNNVTMYEVDVVPERTPDTMRSGMTATVNFNVDGKEGVLIVANEALSTGDDGHPSVLVKGANGPLRTSVELGLSDGKISEVTAGLAEGDVVMAPMLGEKALEKASNPFMPQRPRRAGQGGQGRGGGGR